MEDASEHGTTPVFLQDNPILKLLWRISMSVPLVMVAVGGVLVATGTFGPLGYCLITCGLKSL